MRCDKQWPILLGLGFVSTIIPPLILYIYAFYSYLNESPSRQVPLNNPEFIGEALIPIAVLSLFAATLSVILGKLVVSASKKQWRSASKKQWSGSKLILFFCFMFVIFWLMLFVCAQFPKGVTS